LKPNFLPEDRLFSKKTNTDRFFEKKHFKILHWHVDDSPAPYMPTIRLALTGLGNVNLNLLRILQSIWARIHCGGCVRLILRSIDFACVCTAKNVWHKYIGVLFSRRWTRRLNSVTDSLGL
jgi:hypothetical protein